ncbi:hypothetical protein [Actinophytocola sediminis]
MTVIDPDDPEVQRVIREAARRARVQDAPAQPVVDDLREQLEQGE